MDILHLLRLILDRGPVPGLLRAPSSLAPAQPCGGHDLVVPCLAFEPAVSCVMAAGRVIRAWLEVARGPFDCLVIPGAPLFLALRRESGPRSGVVSGAIPLRRRHHRRGHQLRPRCRPEFA